MKTFYCSVMSPVGYHEHQAIVTDDLPHLLPSPSLFITPFSMLDLLVEWKSYQIRLNSEGVGRGYPGRGPAPPLHFQKESTGFDIR